MYSTSSEHTRVPWAAHSYNVAFSDEIGHFEYCNLSAGARRQLHQAGANDPAGLDADDAYCFNAIDSSYVAVGGCLGTEFDFDGVAYQLVWPGTSSNLGQGPPAASRLVLFSSPTFVPTGQPCGAPNYNASRSRRTCPHRSE